MDFFRPGPTNLCFFPLSHLKGVWKIERLRIILRGFSYSCFLVAFIGCSKPITLKSLLEEMTEREHLSYFPSGKPYALKQLSSYNRASDVKESAGWYANFDMSRFSGVENKNGRREFVLFDEDGPGVIVRWWMTFYKAQDGILRIYLDSDSLPVIEGPPHALLSGEKLADYPFSASVQEGAPRGEEGRDYDHNLYLPIPFASHAKITYECDSMVRKFEYEGIQVEGGYWWPDVFYNICYRQYPEGTRVISFSQESLKKAEPLLERTGKILQESQVTIPFNREFKKSLIPGDSLILNISEKDQAIRRLALSIRATNIEQALRSTVLAVSFDGIRTVWVPVGEFFGSGYMPLSHKTFMNQNMEGGMMESGWVMPFRENCRLIFYNYGSEDITLRGGAGIASYEWKPNSLYFGAAWHEYRHINTRDENGSPFDINFVEIEGQGMYVGDQITLFNNTYHWWGEGDEKIYVDGEKFPSSFGTGSEDYYGYSFGRPDPFSHPFVSQPVGRGNTSWGVTVNMRHRMLDAIPFTSSIRADIELWHWASIKMNYALTTYWYVKEPFVININPDIPAVQYPVSVTKDDFIKTENP
jgi:hypothetical protein